MSGNLSAAFNGILDRTSDKRMASLLRRASELSPTAAALLSETADKRAPAYVFGALTDGTMGTYVPFFDLILLNGRLPDEELLPTLIHETRHVGQYSFSNQYDTKTSLCINRTMEADASAFECAAAYEIGQHEPAVWEAFQKNRPQIAAAYLQEAARPEKALSEAFKAWFDNRRYVGKYDRRILRAMETDYSLKGTSAEILAKICLFKGKTYVTETGFPETPRALAVDRRTALAARWKGFCHGDRSVHDLYAEDKNGVLRPLSEKKKFMPGFRAARREGR